MRFTVVLMITFALGVGAVMALAQVAPQSIALDKIAATHLRNVTAERVKYRDRDALRISDATPQAPDGERLVLLPGTSFKDGVIEVDLTGEPMPTAGQGARGFVGLAFRVSPDAGNAPSGFAGKYECFYLRPTNGRVDDQVRRNHSTQYISFPDFPWQKLRKEFPEKYESYVDLVPGEWTKVKIEVRAEKARLFVHGTDQPVLVVNDLKLGQSEGQIALWLGPGTVAHFANLRVSR